MSSTSTRASGGASGAPRDTTATSPRAQPRLSWLKNPLLLALPACVIGIGVLIYPLAITAGRSMREPEVGLQNYRWLFSDSGAGHNFQSTFMMAAAVTLVCLLLAFPTAYLMTVSSPRTRGMLVVLVLIPFWTSVMVRTLAWIGILQEAGLVNEVLGWVGLGPFELMRNRTGVMIAMTQILLPFMIFPLYSAMQSIDRRLLLAAASLGACRSSAFAKVFLPLSVPGVIAGSVLVFVQSLGFYIVPALLGSPRDAMVSQQIYLQVNGLLDWGRGGAISIALLVCTLLMFGIAGVALRRFNRRFGV